MELIAPGMTRDEARGCVDAITAHMSGARAMLLELYERRGWQALGYSSWRHCVTTEFGQSEAFLYRQLAAAEVEQNLSPIGEIGALPESHLRPLVALRDEPEKQREIYQAAVDTAPNGKITAAHIHQTVREYLEPQVDVSSGSLPFPVIACEACRETFDIKVWHCPRCDHHWQMHVDECRNCHEFRRSAWVKSEDVSPVNRLAVHHSSATAEWYTPRIVIDHVLAFFDEIDLDPCSNSKDAPNVPARQVFTEAENGLAQAWWGRVYMNPPYGDGIGRWVTKLCDSYEVEAVDGLNAGDEERIEAGIALLPARTDTEWFRRLRNYTVCFIKGRLRFVGADNSAPFPSMLVYLGDEYDRFAEVMQPLGDVWQRRNGKTSCSTK